MGLRLRFALICWLLLAVPLHGFAAATLRHCGTAPAAITQAATAHPCHGHQSKAAKASPQTCSACAACHVALVLPATVPAFTAPTQHEAPQVGVAATRIAFVTDGPDRPPRRPLA